MVVEVLPSPPTLTVQDATRDTVQLVWTRDEGEGSSSLGYILSYRPEGSQVYIHNTEEHLIVKFPLPLDITWSLHCNENPIYVFPEMKLHGLVPNSYIHVLVSDLYIPAIVLPILLQKNN